MSRDRYEFLPAALEVRDTPPHPAARAVAGTIVLFFLVALVWAAVGEVDIVAVAAGKIIPSGRVKTVQPLEIGVVKAIHVREGEAVTAGRLLIELDPTENAADLARLANELAAKGLEVARLKALLAALDGDAEVPPAVADYVGAAAEPVALALHQRLLEQRYAEQRARVAALEQEIARTEAELASQRLTVAMLEQTLPLIAKRAEALRQLQGRGLAAEHDYLQLEQERIEKSQQLAIARSRLGELTAAGETARQQRRAAEAEARAGALDALQQAKRERLAVEQEHRKSQERQRRQLLVAPVEGTVQQLAVTTVGGVVTPAQPLLLIVPREDTLEIEAWLPNKDIGFVEEGRRGEVKVETFPFTKYGVIDAEVTDVSDDATSDERQGLVYATRARLARGYMEVEGRRVALTPGMAVTLEVKTGTRRLIEYFLSPLLRYRQEGLRER